SADAPNVAARDDETPSNHMAANAIPPTSKVMMRNAIVFAIVACSAVSSMSAQQDALRFEVASVKLNTTGPQTGRGRQAPEGRFRAKTEPLKSLIAFAFGTEDYKVIAPAWTEDARFDVEATTPPGPRKPGDFGAMMRGLLADRFALRAHREMRAATVYKLTRLYADRLGPNLRAVTVDCEQRTPGQPPPCRLVGLPNGMHAFAQNWSGLLTGY